jgi:thiamine-monophosphate kinase
MRLDWIMAFADGLRKVQDACGLSLLGGDTSRTEGPLSITVTAFGFVPAGRMIPRSGAKAGDIVYVTGHIGDSGGGLALFRREKHALNDTDRDYLIARYRVPEPPLDFGTALVGRATAAVDVSDGLLADLGHIAAASGMHIDIEGETIPRSDALRAFWGDGSAAILRAATAGDDYQIAFTADPAREKELLSTAGTVPVTRIGTVTAGQGVELRHMGQIVFVPRPGYRHF